MIYFSFLSSYLTIHRGLIYTYKIDWLVSQRYWVVLAYFQRRMIFRPTMLCYIGLLCQPSPRASSFSFSLTLINGTFSSHPRQITTLYTLYTVRVVSRSGLKRRLNIWASIVIVCHRCNWRRYTSVSNLTSSDTVVTTPTAYRSRLTQRE